MITLEGVSKIYDGDAQRKPVLKDVSLTVQEGDFLAIMGKSGCGKTTLLNILGLVDTMTSGSYTFCGVDVQKLSSAEKTAFRRDRIGYVYQSFNLLEELNCLENVELTLGYAGVKARQRRARALELLETVGLAKKAKNYPSQLSGGQRQRVAIARALSNHPNLILADEPTGNLDDASGQDIMHLLESLNQQGVNIIMVTHDGELAARCKTQIFLRDGSVVAR